MPTEVPRLLADCVACVRALRLNSMLAVGALCHDSDEVTHLKEAFWLLYIIEKRYSMRTGQFSVSTCATEDENRASLTLGTQMLPDDQISHPLPVADVGHNSDKRQFVSCCLFARLCSHTMQSIHGRNARNTTASHQTEKYICLLDAWKRLWVEDGGEEKSRLGSNTLSISIQYFELLLCIYARDLSHPDKSMMFEEAQLAILRASQDIMGTLNDVDNCGKSTDW